MYLNVSLIKLDDCSMFVTIHGKYVRSTVSKVHIISIVSNRFFIIQWLRVSHLTHTHSVLDRDQDLTVVHRRLNALVIWW